jgi:general secretion pathway protein N
MAQARPRKGNRRLTYLRKGLLGLGVLLLGALLLLWFLPARWVVLGIEPRLHGLQLQQLQGSVWDGRAGQILGPGGQNIGRLQWQLSRLALFGRVCLKLNLDGPQLGFSGTIRRLPADQFEVSAASMHVALDLLGPRAASSLGQPRGELQLSVDRALLQGGWPLQLQATARWRDAVMQTQAGRVLLGNLDGQAQAEGGVIQAQLHDDGHGPLQVDARLQASPLGWRLDATLRARHADPLLRRWLDQLGPADGAGRIHLQRSGGLAALPAGAADNQSTEKP